MIPTQRGARRSFFDDPDGIGSEIGGDAGTKGKAGRGEEIIERER